MKFLIAIVLLGCVLSVCNGKGYTPEELKQFDIYSDECIKESKVKPELVKDLDDYKLAKDDALNDYMFCFGKKYGAISETGKFDKAIIIKDFETIIDTETAKKLADKCTDFPEGDGKKNTVLYIQCFFENKPMKS